MFFCVITKNLNWEVLTVNLVTFKNGMELRMKNVIFMGVRWKIRFLDWGVHEKLIYTGNCSEMAAWTVCRFKGDLTKRRELVFLKEGEWYPNAHCDRK